MAQLREPDGKPVYKDGGPTYYSYVFPDDALQRECGFYLFPPKKGFLHAHKYIEMGLVDHVVCYDCGLCKLRSLIPRFGLVGHLDAS